MGYKKTQALMGTATLTRSQSRKTRSESKVETINRTGLSSPLDILDGNNLNSSSRRRHISKPLSVISSNLSDKENAPPLLIKLGDERRGYGEAQKTPSLPKVVKKRKQSERGNATENSKELSSTSVESASIENPVNMNEHNSQLAAGSSADLSEENGSLHNASKRQVTLSTKCDPIRKGIEILSSGEKDDDRVKEKNKSADETSLSMANCLSLLQRDYDKLYKKYQKLKAKKFVEVEALYEDQNSHMYKFVQASEALLEYHKGEITVLKRQLEEVKHLDILERSKFLEEDNLKYRNHLVEEQSKNLELRKENKRLQSLLLEHVAEKPRSLPTEAVMPSSSDNTNPKTDSDGFIFSGHSKLVQQLLENVLGLQLRCSSDGADIQLHFQHNPTGFAFILKTVHDKDMAELVGGGVLMYQNVSLGVCQKAVNWIKEKEVIFGMDQSQLILKKLIRFFNRGLING